MFAMIFLSFFATLLPFNPKHAVLCKKPAKARGAHFILFLDGMRIPLLLYNIKLILNLDNTVMSGSLFRIVLDHQRVEGPL